MTSNLLFRGALGCSIEGFENGRCEGSKGSREPDVLLQKKNVHTQWWMYILAQHISGLLNTNYRVSRTDSLDCWVSFEVGRCFLFHQTTELFFEMQVSFVHWTTLYDLFPIGTEMPSIKFQRVIYVIICSSSVHNIEVIWAATACEECVRLVWTQHLRIVVVGELKDVHLLLSLQVCVRISHTHAHTPANRGKFVAGVSVAGREISKPRCYRFLSLHFYCPPVAAKNPSACSVSHCQIWRPVRWLMWMKMSSLEEGHQLWEFQLIWAQLGFKMIYLLTTSNVTFAHLSMPATCSDRLKNVSRRRATL